MSTIERLEGKQQATEDILGEVQKALDFLYMAVDSLEASGLFEMNENVRQSKGQHEVTEDFSVDVQEALGIVFGYGRRDSLRTERMEIQI